MSVAQEDDPASEARRRQASDSDLPPSKPSSHLLLGPVDHLWFKDDEQEPLHGLVCQVLVRVNAFLGRFLKVLVDRLARRNVQVTGPQVTRHAVLPQVFPVRLPVKVVRHERDRRDGLGRGRLVGVVQVDETAYADLVASG